ncbi:MAG: prepilin-type N-terminal cleavage/methylation domain-containing protein [Phycisphaerales bacterium]|nr:prepilin-type N-terminal cleavage/methylation domain-containing protein [Phycisphaerales bacterium]
MSEPRARRRGASLVEVLVVIAIVAALLALAVVGIRGSRQAARLAASLSNLRQHASVFALYAGEWDDAFPNFAKTDRYVTIIPIPDSDYILELPYFGQHFAWSLLMARDWYDGQRAHPSFSDPETAVRGVFSNYYYGCCFIADPAYWRDTTRLDGFSQWRATRRHEVAFPDRKALFVRSTYERGRPVQYATIDGSAGTRSQQEASGGGYPYGDGLHEGSIHPADVHYYLHTIDGVRGRDLRD